MRNRMKGFKSVEPNASKGGFSLNGFPKTASIIPKKESPRNEGGKFARKIENSNFFREDFSFFHSAKIVFHIFLFDLICLRWWCRCRNTAETPRGRCEWFFSVEINSSTSQSREIIKFSALFLFDIKRQFGGLLSPPFHLLKFFHCEILLFQFPALFCEN